MNASIKLLLEESIKLERLVNIKTTLLKLPVNILTTKEIKEISFTPSAVLPSIVTTLSLRTSSSMKYRSVSSQKTHGRFPTVRFLPYLP